MEGLYKILTVIYKHIHRDKKGLLFCGLVEMVVLFLKKFKILLENKKTIW